MFINYLQDKIASTSLSYCSLALSSLLSSSGLLVQVQLQLQPALSCLLLEGSSFSSLGSTKGLSFSNGFKEPSFLFSKSSKFSPLKIKPFCSTYLALSLLTLSHNLELATTNCQVVTTDLKQYPMNIWGNNKNGEIGINY